MTRTTLMVLAVGALLALPQASADGPWTVLPTGQAPVTRDMTRGPDTMLLQSPNQVNGFFSDIGCGNCGGGVQIIGDNFVVSTAGAGFTLDEISIWGGYFPGDVPTAAPFDIYVASDSSGQPGPVVCSETGIMPTSDTLTGVTLFGVSEHLIQFSLTPCSLADGAYWLYLYTDTGAGDDFFWETGSLDATNGVAGSVFTTQNPPATWAADSDAELAVRITGTVVPVELQFFAVE